MKNLKQVFNKKISFMDFYLTIIIVIFVIYYLFRPTTKKEEENFNSKNNWRGGF